MCETKSVTTAMYLNFNEDGVPDYRFVGKVGLFTPVLEGAGGAELLRLGDDKFTGENTKFSAVTGTKKKDGSIYRWMESEMVKELGLQDKIDKSYYNTLVDEAIDAISKYGDFEWFVSDDDSFMEPPLVPGEDEIPFKEYQMCA